jgi:hypothetical protein
MSLTELRVAMETVREGLAGDDVNIFFGAAVKPRLGEEMRVSLIASVDYHEMQAAILAEAEEAVAEPEEALAVQEPETPEDAFEDEVEPYAEEAGEVYEDALEAGEENGAPLLEPDDEFIPEPVEPASVPAEPVRYEAQPEPLPSWEPAPAPAPAPAVRPARQSEFNLDMSFGSVADAGPADVMNRVEDMFGDEEDDLERMISGHSQPAATRPARNINVLPKREVMEAEAEISERVRSMFDDEDDEADMPSAYAPSRASQPRGPLGYNDMSDMFNTPLP